MTDHEPLDGAYTAVLDRFEDELAVLLVEANDSIVTEVTIDRSDLPTAGRHQDAIFDAKFEHDELVLLDYDPETTDERTEAAQNRFDRLSKRLPNDDEST